MKPTEIRGLLDKLCVDLGFCLPPSALRLLEQAPPDDANEFARAVFTAEGLDPDSADLHLFRQVRRYVTEAMRKSHGDDRALTVIANPMNKTQSAIFVGAHEESGLWDVISDLANGSGISRRQAFELLQGEIKFLESRSDIYLIRSQGLYQSESCEVLEKKMLQNMTLDEVEFRESGPFYYLSVGPTV